METDMKIVITRKIIPDEELIGFMGVVAVAKIHFPREGHTVLSELESPGFWGIDVNAGEGYLNEMFAGEVKTLVEMIEALQRGPVEYEIVTA
jgi:hypothetical protein